MYQRLFIVMVKNLNWVFLTTRRYNQHLIMLFKILHDLITTGHGTMLQNNDIRITESYIFFQPFATQSVYKSSQPQGDQ